MNEFYITIKNISKKYKIYKSIPSKNKTGKKKAIKKITINYIL